MIRLMVAIICLLVLAMPAQAKGHGHHRHHGHHFHSKHAVRHHHHWRHHRGHRGSVDVERSADRGRPSAWCGWYGRFNFLGHDPGPEYNLAANWRRIGTPDQSPHSGDIAVWPHHVGKIVGECSGHMCPVLSGNDGHAVRTRVRSVAGAVFRRV